MGKPATQSVAGGYVLEPIVHGHVGFFHAPRPQPLDEKTCPILGCWRVVDTLGSYHPLPFCPSGGFITCRASGADTPQSIWLLGIRPPLQSAHAALVFRQS